MHCQKPNKQPQVRKHAFTKQNKLPHVISMHALSETKQTTTGKDARTVRNQTNYHR